MSSKIIKYIVALLFAATNISIYVALYYPQYAPMAWEAVLWSPLMMFVLLMYDSLAAGKKKVFVLFVLLLLLGGIFFEFVNSGV